VKWATRANIHIDRAACAWLIHRHADPAAEFVFVSDPAELPADATPFDIRGVDLSHHHGDCSFESILRRYELTDPVLWKIAESSTKPTSTMNATTLQKPPASTSPCAAYP
jgi:hypothetical protein